MPTIEEILTYDYDTVKNYILTQKPFMLEALKDTRIKKKLIDVENKYELIWLVQEIPDAYALVLFDDEGIKILRETTDLNAKMNAIITSGKKYVNELLKKKSFCHIINGDEQYLKNSLYAIDTEGALAFVKYIEKNNPENLNTVLLHLSNRIHLDVVKEINIPSSILKNLIVGLSPEAFEYLINNDMRVLSLNNYSFDELFSIASKNCHISRAIIEEPALIEKLSSMESVKDYRFLIDKLSKSNDVEHIEKKRQTYYDKELLSYDHESKMLKRYHDFYLEFCALIAQDDSKTSQLEEIISKYFNFFGSSNNEWEVKKHLYEYFDEKDKEGLNQFLVNESNVQMSNMIIDYHFKDVPYNFFLDIKQLCHFQENEGRTLNDEDLSIYNRLLTIDSLSYEEKMLLHKELSQKDWVDKNYDIFREAKDKSANLIKEQMLNKDNVQEYYDEELSKKHGVPIYVLDGQEFFAFVKSLNFTKHGILAKEDINYNVDGSSFSLDGSNKLNTFKNPREVYNLIYSDFPTSQVVHMYPVDSFTLYIRNFSEPGTPRVYELSTPTELVEKSSDYSEILLAQPNQTRTNDEVNDKLKVPTIMGIYCYDKFTPNDVESAKNLGIGIVVVKTMSYDVKKEGKIKMNETTLLGNNAFDKGINYLDQFYYDDMKNRRVK